MFQRVINFERIWSEDYLDLRSCQNKKKKGKKKRKIMHGWLRVAKDSLD